MLQKIILLQAIELNTNLAVHCVHTPLLCYECDRSGVRCHVSPLRATAPSWSG
jgi:hypothetical protein